MAPRSVSPSQYFHSDTRPTGLNEIQPLRRGAREVDNHAIRGNRGSRSSVDDDHEHRPEVREVRDAHEGPEWVRGVCRDKLTVVEFVPAGGRPALERLGIERSEPLSDLENLPRARNGRRCRGC